MKLWDISHSANPRLIWTALVKPLSASAWCLCWNCVSLRGQALELRHLCSTTDLGWSGTGFWPSWLKNPSSQLSPDWIKETLRHFCVGSFSNCVATSENCDVSLCVTIVYLWNALQVLLTSYCFCPSLKLITESKSLSKPFPSDSIVIKKCVSLTSSKMPNAQLCLP